MKQILIFGLLLGLLACGEIDTVKPPVIDEPFVVPILETPLPNAVTPKGTVLGDAVSGVYYLPRQPFGAGSSAKVVLQEIENTMPNAASKTAYRVTFDPPTAVLVAPLELYLSVDAEEVILEDLLFGEQNSDGSWQAKAPTIIPAVSGVGGSLVPQALPQLRVIQLPVTKQGDFALATKYALIPREASVRIGEEVIFAVSAITTDASNLASISVSQVQSWSVNNTVGGSQVLGRITDSSANKATYTAPTVKPNPAVVKIKAVANNKTYQSSVQIMNSKGWVNIVANDFSKISRTDYSETYIVSISGQYETSKASKYTPAATLGGNTFPESLEHGYLKTIKEEGFVYLTYNKTSRQKCACQDAIEVRTESYDYYAEKLVEDPDQLEYFSTELKPNQSKHFLVRTFRFKGSLKYSSNHTPCPDDTPEPPVKINSIQESFAGIEVRGDDLHPKNRKYLRGAGTLKLNFSPPKAGSVKEIDRVSYYYASWFLPLIETKILSAPVQPQRIPVPQFSPRIPSAQAVIRPQC